MERANGDLDVSYVRIVARESYGRYASKVIKLVRKNPGITHRDLREQLGNIRVTAWVVESRDADDDGARCYFGTYTTRTAALEAATRFGWDKCRVRKKKTAKLRWILRTIDEERRRADKSPRLISSMSSLWWLRDCRRILSWERSNA